MRFVRMRSISAFVRCAREEAAGIAAAPRLATSSGSELPSAAVFRRRIAECLPKLFADSTAPLSRPPPFLSVMTSVSHADRWARGAACTRATKYIPSCASCRHSRKDRLPIPRAILALLRVDLEGGRPLAPPRLVVGLPRLVVGLPRLVVGHPRLDVGHQRLV